MRKDCIYFMVYQRCGHECLGRTWPRTYLEMCERWWNGFTIKSADNCLKFCFLHDRKCLCCKLGEIKKQKKHSTGKKSHGNWSDWQRENWVMKNFPTESILQFHHFLLKLIFFEQGYHLASWFVATQHCANWFTSPLILRDASDNSFCCCCCFV